jgi:hypothetical protein
VQCPGGLGNPFVHLRLGQTNLELGADDTAADEPTRAYMRAESDVFLEDDPKYFEFLGPELSCESGSMGLIYAGNGTLRSALL